MPIRDEVKKIVILGGGFGGVTAAMKLSKMARRGSISSRLRLILINRNEYQVYTPALYEIAAIPKGGVSAASLKSSMCIDLGEVAKKNGFLFVGGEVTRINHERRSVEFARGGPLSFDWLIIALGAETNYFNIPGLKEHAFPLKTFEDAIRLRNRVESAVLSGDDPIHIVIGGAGATGVELAAEFNNFLCSLRARRTPHRTCRADITLIDAAPHILPGFDSGVMQKTYRRLEKFGIKILNGKIVAAVDERSISCKDGLILPYHIFVWTGGVSPVRTLKNLGLMLSLNGKIVVDEFLRVRTESGAIAEGVYAVGDNAEFVDPATAVLLPGNVPVAEAEARIAAKNVVADLAGKPRRKFTPLKKYPYILAVGRKHAIADLVVVRFSGLAGWLAKQLVELRYLISILGFWKATAMWARSIRYQASND